MSYLNQTKVAGHVLLSAAGLLLSSSALAQFESECDVDADCEQGFACEVTGGGGSCSASECDEFGNCTPGVCETFEFRSCVPGPCSDDSDCSEGMVCHTSSYTTCTDPARICEGGEDCSDAYEPPSCEEHSESHCTPRHQLPCTADADCGEGFRCIEERWIECSGGGTGGGSTNGGVTGGVNGWDGAPMPVPPAEGEGPDDEPYECEEKPSGYFYCELLELPCETNSDCPSTMECQESYPVCTGGGSFGGGTTGGNTGFGGATPDGGTEVVGETYDLGELPPDFPDPYQEDSDPALYEDEKGDWEAREDAVCGIPEGVPAKVCRPPYYYGGGYYGGGTTGSNSGAGGLDEGGYDDGTYEPPVNGGGGTTGGSSGQNGGSTVGAGSGTADDETGGDGRGHGRRNVSDWVRGRRHGRGCSLSSAASQPGDNLTLLFGVGLALALRRRRSQ